MNKFKKISIIISVFSIIGITYASLGFPSFSHPTGKNPGGELKTVFDNISLYCGDGKYLQGFTSSGGLICRSISSLGTPTGTPVSNYATSGSGKYTKYLENILNDCGVGRYVKGFDGDKKMICSDKDGGEAKIGLDLSTLSSAISVSFPSSPSGIPAYTTYLTNVVSSNCGQKEAITGFKSDGTKEGCVNMSVCTYTETLSNGYYVIDANNANCSQGCATPGLPDANNKCILKVGTTYIAPGATDVEKTSLYFAAFGYAGDIGKGSKNKTYFAEGTAYQSTAGISTNYDRTPDDVGNISTRDTRTAPGYCNNATWGEKSWYFPKKAGVEASLELINNNKDKLLGLGGMYISSTHKEGGYRDGQGDRWGMIHINEAPSGRTDYPWSAKAHVRCVADTLPENAICGSSNGANLTIKPTAGLCSKGTASFVNGIGPWTWTCEGINGGTDVSCSANKKQNAVCGSADGDSLTAKPTTNLCTVGADPTPTVSGSGPWTWTCVGKNGGTNASCSAQKACTYAETLTNGYYVVNASVSGCAQGCATPGLPDANNKCILKVGSTYIAPGATDVQKQNTPCGGSASPCSTTILTNNTNVMGYCGNATWGGKDWYFPRYPTNTVNNTTKILSEHTGNYWTRHCENCDQTTAIKWRINDSSGAPQGRSNQHYVRCESATVSPTNAVCGSADGDNLTTKPTTNLCSVASDMTPTVNGTGPWTWTCAGKNGGTNASCSANKKQNGVCGSADNDNLTTKPTTNLCSVAVDTTPTVNGTGPWTWTCAGINGGTNASCNANKVWDCNADIKIGTKYFQACNAILNPHRNYKNIPANSMAVNAQGWRYGALYTKSTMNAACPTGYHVMTTNEANYAYTNLSNSWEKFRTTLGIPYAGTWDDSTSQYGHRDGDKDPGARFCLGDGLNKLRLIQGGSPIGINNNPNYINNAFSVRCVKNPINGVCGTSDGDIVSQAPTTGLCSKGTPTTVNGTGPWSWTCNGDGGGSNASCSAQKACIPAQTLSNGYYVVNASVSGCSQGCATPGLPDANNKCILKVGSTYIAPGATDVQKTSLYFAPLGYAGEIGKSSKQKTYFAEGTSYQSKAGISTNTDRVPDEVGNISTRDTRTAPGYCNNATWGGLSWYFPKKAGVEASLEVINNNKNKLLGLGGMYISSTHKEGGYRDNQGDRWGMMSINGAATTRTDYPWKSLAHVRCVADTTPENAVCGASANQTFVNKPTTGLCWLGEPTDVTGSGPRSWTCNGASGGSDVTCTANKTVINGSCGTANNTNVVSYPTSGHCLRGTRLDIDKVGTDGTFNWNCNGINGTNANCSANKKQNGVCGSADDDNLTSIPTTNLCTVASDTTPTVSGAGPWTWTCAGINGGTNVSCNANKAVWEGTATTGFKLKINNTSYLYPTTCNHLFANTFKVGTTAPWDGTSFDNGYYYIEIGGIVRKAYCNMTMDGGGWTRIYDNNTTAINMTRMRNCKNNGSYYETDYECINPSYFTKIKFQKGTTYHDITDKATLIWMDSAGYYAGSVVGWGRSYSEKNSYSMREFENDSGGSYIGYNALRFGSTAGKYNSIVRGK